MFFKKCIKEKFKQKIRKIKTRYREQLKKERNKYVCILNHDIKTPLLAQIRSLELILKNQFGQISLKQAEIISDILNSHYFLLQVVTNSIFLSKYENEQPKLKLENVDILEQVEDCCNMIRNFAQDKHQNFIIKTDKAKKIKLNADKKLIQKIIFNILASSVSYGFEKSDIEVLLKENKNSVEFCTKNKSIYMSPKKLDSLFDDKENLSDFNQLGMNLNLNIAKKLIDAHNWNLIAESQKDNSSKFGFVVYKK